MAAVAAACASAPPAAEAPSPCELPAQGSDPAPFLWEVSCEDRPGRAYLVGSVHVRERNAGPLPAPILQALEDSDVVVQEANVPGLLGSMVLLVQSGAFNWFEKTRLRPETWALLEPRLTELNMDRKTAERLEPWALYLALEVTALEQAGYDTQSGVDATLKRLAQASDPPKPLRYMETAASQIRLFSELDPEQQEQLLVQTLKSDPTESETLIEAYEAGQLRSLCEATLQKGAEDEEIFPGFEDRLLHDRNRHFVRYTLELLKTPGTAMVVAGAAHMVGPTGMPHLLAEAGCRVQRHPSANGL